MPRPVAQNQGINVCPYCWMQVSAAGGGLANHISRSPHCRSQQQQQMANIMNCQPAQSTLQAARVVPQLNARSAPSQAIGNPTTGEYDQTRSNDEYYESDRSGFGNISMGNGGSWEGRVASQIDSLSQEKYYEHDINRSPSRDISMGRQDDIPLINSDSEDDGDIPAGPEVDIQGASFVLPDSVNVTAAEGNEEAGWVLGSRTKTMYDRMLAAEDRGDTHYPWKDFAEWEMVQFLSRSGMSQALIDDFLKLHYVSCSPL